MDSTERMKTVLLFWDELNFCAESASESEYMCILKKYLFPHEKYLDEKNPRHKLTPFHGKTPEHKLELYHRGLVGDTGL